VRAIGDVQRRGLEAAKAIVDGFIAALDGAPTNNSTERSDDGAPRSDLDGLVALWEQLARGAIDVVAGLARVSASTMTGRSGDVRLAGSTAPVRVVVDQIGGSRIGTTQVWMHYDGDEERSALRPHFGELRSAEGAVLDATVTFEPSVVDLDGGANSRPLLLRVATAPAATPGTYKGLALVEGLPDTWLVVEVLVT
jgi:hypothetical protein